MAEFSYRFGFSCEVTTLNGMLVYGPYRISKGATTKQLKAEPPPVFRNVIFDILQEYSFYRGRLNIEHTIAYVHIERPTEHDLVCLDVATLEPEHRIDTKRSIVPAKYNVYNGIRRGGKTYFFGDIYNSVIQGDWANAQPLALVSRDTGKPHWSQFAGFVDLKFAVTSDHNKFQFDGEFVVRRHVLGEMAGLAPIPKFPEAGGLPRHAVVVAHWIRESDDKLVLKLSDEAFGNLKNLGQLLEYRGAQTVWVFGAPGSGKEVFAQALHAGSVVSRDKTLRTRSVAGVKLEEFNQRLFASQTGKLCLIEEVDGGGTLFLDEFDKMHKEHVKPICSTLLRVLEADEYIREVIDGGGNKSESAAKIDEVNWIFAGAFSTSGTSSIPADFWSRLTGWLRIVHPVRGGREYAATLFLYFYVSEAIRRLGPRRGVYIESFVQLLETAYTERRFNEQITANLLGGGDSFLNPNERIVPSKLLMQLTTDFAAEVCVGEAEGEDGTPGKVDSSRGIRQAAKAAFFAMRQSAIEHGDQFDFEKASGQALEVAHEMLVTSRGAVELPSVPEEA